jgi:hypothetical protein
VNLKRKGVVMPAKEVRGRVSKGKIEPLEELDLPEGTGVIILLEEAPPEAPPADRTLKALRATAGAWKGTHDPEKLKRNIYADRLLDSRPEPKI